MKMLKEVPFPTSLSTEIAPLGREERFEDAFHRFRLHAMAGVGYCEADIISRSEILNRAGECVIDFTGMQGHAKSTTFIAHGVRSVRAEIHQDLVDL